MAVDPNAPTEENETVRVPVARRQLPIVAMVAVVAVVLLALLIAR